MSSLWSSLLWGNDHSADNVPRRQRLPPLLLQQHDGMDSALAAEWAFAVRPTEEEALEPGQHTEAIVDDSKDDSPGADDLPVRDEERGRLKELEGKGSKGITT